MKLINYSVIVITLAFFTSCDKELSLELANTPPPSKIDTSKVDTVVKVDPPPPIDTAQAFQDFLINKKFQIRDFYSDIPVDYIETDQTVKQETELWEYASNYIKDDYNIFTLQTTNVDVQQNTLKMPGTNTEVLHKKYRIFKDENGVHMTFLDYKYNPLTYDLYEMGKDYFILSVKWKQNATLYSRFEMIP